MTEQTEKPPLQSEKPPILYRLKLLALFSVFLLPFIAGWLALYVFDYRPDSKNYGDLVQPVRPLSFPLLTTLNDKQLDKNFWNKWTFVLLDKGKCINLCRENLYYLRQMRVALGRDMDRVQNLLIVGQAVDDDLSQFLTEYPKLTVINQAASALFEKFKLPGIETGESPMLYLIDPAGNLMITYPAVNKPKSILSDIRRLLKVSQIG